MVSITPSESIDLDLVVESPEVVELPLRGADDPVSGAVVKLGRAGWDDEGCCGSGRVLEVAERDLWSGDEQLSLVPVGHLAKLLVGDSRLHPRQGRPDRNEAVAGDRRRRRVVPPVCGAGARRF